jgi:WD40 repeat protein
VSSGRCLGDFEGHTDVVTSIALSADGRFVLSGSTDRTVRLWEVESGRCLRVFEGHSDPVFSVSLSADARLALSGGAQFLVRNERERLFTSGQMRLWDTASGQCLPTFQGQSDPVTAVHLKFSGRRVLSGGGLSILQHHSGRFSQVGQLHLWQVSTGRRLGNLNGHTNAVTSVCISLDGHYALSGSTDRTVKLWHLPTGRCVRTFAGHGDAVTSVALSQDGRYALSGSVDQTLKLWILDWELLDRQPSDWDDGVRYYLLSFLALHTYRQHQPAAQRKRTRMQLPWSRLFRAAAQEEQDPDILTCRGKPDWTEADFQELLRTLGCAGYGWLRPEGIRRRLERLTRRWKALPPLPGARMKDER